MSTRRWMPERVELRAVGVEAAGERVLGHVRVALDVAPDLRGRDGPALRHQVGDQRELPDQLLGVLRQRPSTLVSAPWREPLGDAAGPRFLRSFDPLHHEVVTGLPLSLRLVLVEDHQALREGLELLLGREGCDGRGHRGLAGRGPALIERTEPDVALVDIRLGDESGIDLTRRAARRRPGPPHRPLHRRRATSSCCSAGWTPARAATRSRRARRASSPARCRRSPTAARTSTRACAPRCCRAAPRSGCPRCPSASARSWTCSPRA